MKYRDVILNGSDGFQFKLVKYRDEYNVILDNFYNVDEELLDCVKEFPKIYSELSDYQSYIIFDNKKDICIGLVCIGTSCDEKDLEVKIQVDEREFSIGEEFYIIVDQIIDILGYCFRNMNNIEVDLVNKIDLSNYSDKYKKIIYDEKMITYVFCNKIDGKKRVYGKK